jgi:hypothetical protein
VHEKSTEKVLKKEGWKQVSGVRFQVSGGMEVSGVRKNNKAAT